MKDVKRVAVIGAGVIGTACAHYLRQAGLEVVLLDRGRVGGACSHANCGYVCPSHVLPLAGPGVIGKTLPLLWQRDSPLRIRLLSGPGLWGWLWRFARRCNRRDMIAAGHGIAALLNSSRALYGDLFRTEPLEAEWEERGLMFVFRTPREHEHYAEVDRLLREEFHMPAVRYDGEALVKLEPALKPGVAGGWHYTLDAHLRADKLMSSWKALLLSRGVELREGCELTGFRVANGQAAAAQTSVGEVAADVFVVAMGAWTPLLNRWLGCRVPIQPGKGYSITMARPTRCPTIPLIFEEDRVAVTPMASGYRLGSTMEFAGYDDSMNKGRLEILRRAARLYLHEPEAEPVQEQWWGWRPMVPDGKPIIDRAPALANVMIAAGHGMLGLSMAPATGKLVTELLTQAKPHVDAGAYALRR